MAGDVPAYGTPEYEAMVTELYQQHARLHQNRTVAPNVPQRLDWDTVRSAVAKLVEDNRDWLREMASR